MIRNLIGQLNNNILDSIDLSPLEKYITEYYMQYFLKESGEEHYRLLSYLGSCIHNETILDIGTHHGSSAVALSYKNSNQIISYDIENHKQGGINFPDNITFIIGNVLDNIEIIRKSKIIMIDTAHDGNFERQFLNSLKKINYHGCTLWDDIYLNDAMRHFWNTECKNENKIDISNLGHWSGTGVIFF